MSSCRFSVLGSHGIRTDVEPLQASGEEDGLPPERPAGEPEPRQPLEQQRERDAELEARERGADAEVDALAERDVPVEALPPRVVARRAREHVLVPVHGAVVDHQPRALREGHAAERDLPRRHAEQALRRRLEPEDLLDGPRHELQVGPELVGARPRAEEQHERVADRARHGDVPGDDEVERDAHHGVARQRRVDSRAAASRAEVRSSPGPRSRRSRSSMKQRCSATVLLGPLELLLERRPGRFRRS